MTGTIPQATLDDSIDARNQDWVEEALAEHLSSKARIDQLGLLKLSPAIKGLMWVLRAYVIFMITVVAVNVVQQVH